MHSESEENYLKSISILSEQTDRLAGTNDLAELLKTKASSVTDMIKKLSVKGLVSHVPYKGAELTEEGRKKALLVIRRHRLWETFLVNVLNFSWDDVHVVAEQLEHVNSPLLVDRLDAFLEFPTRDPHGDPIPNKKGEYQKEKDQILVEQKINTTVEVVRVKDTSISFLNHLDSIEINIGTRIRIRERFDYDQSLKVEINGVREIVLSEKSCENLFIKQL